MRRLVLVALVVCALAGTAWGVVPGSITVQGRLTDSGGDPLPPGIKSFTFKICDAAVGGNEIWPLVSGEEVHSINTNADGLWTAVVGATLPLSDAVFADSVRWLEITVDGTTLPRTRLATGPYAYRVSTVDGASGGTITGKVSIGPGHTNTGSYAFVTGTDNEVAGNYSAVGGGTLNHATGESGVISGGQQNTASGFASVVAGGASNSATHSHSVVGGGLYNSSSGFRSVVGGGILNAANGEGAVVGGGGNNHASGLYSTVAGGGGNSDQTDSNSANGDFSQIGGGFANVASGYASGVAGGHFNRASGAYSTVSGGQFNFARGSYSTIAGGGGPSIFNDTNSAAGTGNVIGGGAANLTREDYSTISGGSANRAFGAYSSVSGGFLNTAFSQGSHIGGGVNNEVDGLRATVGGGQTNYAAGSIATIGGGEFNTASGEASTVPGGSSNAARGGFSFATGSNARANHSGSFVWGDRSDIDSVYSTASNQFIIRAAGGVGIGTTSPQQALSVVGGMNIDQADANNGSVANGLRFGSGSGEAIASKRSVGGNIYGLDFYCNFVNRMSITNLGNVGIGTTTPTTPSGGRVLHVDNPSGPSVLRLDDGAANGIQWEIQSTVINGTGVLNFSNVTAFANPMQLYGNGNLNVSGNVCAANVVCPSDARLKEHISEIPDALNLLQRLRGVEYEWTAEAQSQRSLPSTMQIGVIAQEVREAVPQAVIEQSDGYLAVDYSRLVAVLIEGMKEQQVKIDSLQVRLAALESRP